jgi:hypothetical protein
MGVWFFWSLHWYVCQFLRASVGPYIISKSWNSSRAIPMRKVSLAGFIVSSVSSSFMFYYGCYAYLNVSFCSFL